MIDSNEERLRGFYACVAAGDLDGATAGLAPDVELRTRLETYRGRDAVARMLAEQFTEWSATIDVTDVIEPAPDVVVTSLHLRMLGRHSGISVDQHLFDVARLRNGVVVAVEVHDQLDEALAAAERGAG